MLTTQLIKAARALLGWDQLELARRADVGVATIRRIEAVSGVAGGSEMSLEKIKTALEQGGIEFLKAGRRGGEGVRRRFGDA